ncbi:MULTISPECIES: hypothetical protein [Gordonia]|uniref:hypothetical protein n=1 Tax=Gordonia TaxID=2053 RepID=UPI0039C879ED
MALGTRAEAAGSRAVVLGIRAVALGTRVEAAGSRAVVLGIRAVVLGIPGFRHQRQACPG